jgi:hypothetical protein
LPDFSIALPSQALDEQFGRVVDVEGKVLTALEALGPVVDRDVVVLDSGRGELARRAEEMGARVEAFGFPLSDGDSARLAGWVGRADCVIVPLSEMAHPGSRFIAEASALLKPCGRLLILHDYGRDDVWALFPDRRERAIAWSHRRGPFLGEGFRIRVVHSWWTFESIEHARELLGTVFGRAGVEVADSLKKLRMEYSVAIYHRSAPAASSGASSSDEATAAGLVTS